MLIPAATWSDSRLASYNKALDEVSRHIARGEKLTKRKIVEIAKSCGCVAESEGTR